MESMNLSSSFKRVSFTAVWAVALMASTASFAQVCPFDNGGSTLENDGLVLTRYALGLRGAPMVANTSFAVGDAATIESNIACPSCGLNVTGGATFTSTDATIISRKIAGFNGAALTNGLGLSGPTVAAVNSFLLAGCGTTSNGWVQGGNAFGAPGVLGTTDGQSLTVGTGLGDGLRIIRSNTVVPPGLTGTSKTVNVINGSRENSVAAGISAATIAGGGYFNNVGTSSEELYPNQVLGSGGSVGGGALNTAGTLIGFSRYATVAGGFANTASGDVSTVSGGANNVASRYVSTVSGGQGNQANADFSTVPGGTGNRANGDYSFAAGSNATASDAREFVWNGSSSAWNPKTAGLWAGDTTSTFNARTDRGFYFQTGGGTACTLGAGGTGWGCTSDRALKEKIFAVSPRAVLEKVASLPVSTWVIKGFDQLHMGPMAQDFRAAFGLGRDDKTINTTDAQGVALAAIQGLNQKLTEQIKQKDKEIAKLKASYDADIAAIKRKLGM
jgi:trimeric autotransporter adhesin